MDTTTGEVLDVTARLIVSPEAGVFHPLAVERDVARGDVIGHLAVAGHERVPIRSAFAGRLVEVVAWPGERMARGQRIAWLEVA
jgi:hypothetical protein